MVRTLRESKAKLSELVERASNGEDVLITVRGKVKARLTKAEAAPAVGDRTEWLKELAALRNSMKTGNKSQITPQEFWDELREDRI
jgi:prevent-host-death family protein